MNKKTKIFCIFCAIVVIVAIAITIFGNINAPDNAKSQYYCDNNSWSVALDIDVKDKDRNSLYNISGEFFGKYEEDLLMKNLEGDVVREMSDDYNIISQNDHVIMDWSGFLYSCEGNFELAGNSYKVYSNEKEQIATMEINALNTYGTIRNMDGKVVAQYNSSAFFADYVVSIFDGCEIDDESVLMMFASCVSDIRSDSN